MADLFAVPRQNSGGTIVYPAGSTGTQPGTSGTQTGYVLQESKPGGFVYYGGYIDRSITDYYDPRRTAGRGGTASPTGADGFGIYVTEATKNLVRDHETLLRAVRANIQAINAPYTGKTQAERLKYLESKMDAITGRGQFIADRAKALIESAKSETSESVFSDAEFKTSFAVWSAAVSVLPGGALFAGVSAGLIKLVDSSNQKNAAERKSVFYRDSLNGYADDAKKLAALKTAVESEGKALAAELGTTYNAPTIGQYWPYIVAAVVLIGLLIYLRKKRKRPRRR